MPVVNYSLVLFNFYKAVTVSQIFKKNAYPYCSNVALTLSIYFYESLFSIMWLKKVQIWRVRKQAGFFKSTEIGISKMRQQIIRNLSCFPIHNFSIQMTGWDWNWSKECSLSSKLTGMDTEVKTSGEVDQNCKTRFLMGRQKSLHSFVDEKPVIYLILLCTRMYFTFIVS